MINYPLNVTIDTNIFISNKFDIDVKSTLGLLVKYVNNNQIRVFLSNIVIAETLKHIEEKSNELADEINGRLKKMKKNYSSNFLKNANIDIDFHKINKDEFKEKNKQEFKSYLRHLQAEVLKIENIDVNKIFKNYFKSFPPFESKSGKKSEFPDAFIIEQINNRFSSGEYFAVISNDKGFQHFFKDLDRVSIYNSLGELYDKIKQQDKMYSDSVNWIRENIDILIKEISYNLIDENCIDLSGIEYDSEGIFTGYEYTESYVEKINKVEIKSESIDDIQGKKVTARLNVKLGLCIKCYYEDFDDAIWDSETKTYLYLETKEVIEEHCTEGEIRVEIDLEENSFKIIPFILTLDNQSIINRTFVENNYEKDFSDNFFESSEELFNSNEICSGCGLPFNDTRYDVGGKCISCAHED